MKRSGLAPLLVASALMLAGCHADVTYKLDVHPNKTVTVTTREVLDDQLYDMTLGQDTSGDPFGLDAAKRAGWAVSRTTDEDGNHVMTMARTVPFSDLADAVGSMPHPRGHSIPFTPKSLLNVHTATGLFTDTHSINTTIPAFMPKPQSDSASESSDSLASAGASMAASMMSSILSLHLEVRTPGKVVSTNGETMPDGFVRWDMNLQGPTRIRYAVQTPDMPHIAIAVAVGVLLLLIIFGGVMRARRRSAFSPIPAMAEADIGGPGGAGDEA